MRVEASGGATATGRAELELVTECEVHSLRWFVRPGAAPPRECPQCRREEEGLTAAERRSARKRELCVRTGGRAGRDHADRDHAWHPVRDGLPADPMT